MNSVIDGVAQLPLGSQNDHNNEHMNEEVLTSVIIDSTQATPIYQNEHDNGTVY